MAVSSSSPFAPTSSLSSTALSPGHANAPSAIKYYSAAVCRSAELVSCAKTVVKIAQSRHAKQQLQQQIGQEQHQQLKDEWFTHLNPADLALQTIPRQRHQQQQSSVSSTAALSEDGLSLLRAMELELNRLEGLVRRRGHSNDPTVEITNSVNVLQQDAAELTGIIRSLVPPSSSSSSQSQKSRHAKAIQEWFQAAAARQAKRLKAILAVRGTVLAEQAQRRQRFVLPTPTATSAANNNNNTPTTAAASTATLATAAAANALFARPPPSRPAASLPLSSSSSSSSATMVQAGSAGLNATLLSDTNATSNRASATTFASNTAGATAGYGGGRSSLFNYATSNNNGSTGQSSYYQQSNNSNSSDSYYNNNKNHNDLHSATAMGTTGMRQRKGESSNTNSNTYSNNNSNDNNQFLVQQYQEKRQSASRLKEAVHAEKSLAALGTVFGKMSTLLAQQSETMQKVEDDVEAAHVDVVAGREQIHILYAIKKGNRPLIIKVYALLIFLIVFMRFYAKRG